jgi:Zn-dependent metalloprotease
MTRRGCANPTTLRLIALATLLAAGFTAPMAHATPAIRVQPLQRSAPVVSAAPTAAVDPRAAALAERLRARLAAGPLNLTRTQQHQAAAVAALRQDGATKLEVRFRAGVGTPSLVRGAGLQRATTAGKGADIDTARAFLRRHRALLRLEDPDAELALERSDDDELGRRHLRFAQQHDGLPVWPAGLIVHLDPYGDVDALDGAFVPTPRVATIASVSADAAIAAARDAVADGDAAPTGGPVLIVYAPGDRPARLAWKLTVSVAPAERWLVVIDALSGDPLTSFNEVHTLNAQGSGVDLFGDTRPLNVWNEDGSFYLVDTSKPSFDPTSDPPDPATTRGAIVVLDARNQPPNDNPQDIPELFYVLSPDRAQWDVPDGVSAAFSLSVVYDYYRARHARNSLDGADGGLLGIVRLGRGYQNAFWSGSYMAFGDGDLYAGSLDVVAHELAHGVTQYTANLVYQDEPGALNEALSDIFGESVEAFATGATDWLVGSQLTEPIRDMADPTRFGDPATYSNFIVTDLDHGGVHSNSGIINHAFYLLAEGLDDAIGLRDAERIFYQALAFHLVANSRFIDARLAAVSAARELFGEDSPQALRTAAAFDAVEIFDGGSTPEPQPFPGVNGEDATLFLFYDPSVDEYFLARREGAQQDGEGGVQLVESSVAPVRPAVAGDGSFAVFVDTNNDVCLTTTDGSPISEVDPSPSVCLGFPGLVRSAAVSPDGARFGFVLLTAGMPDNAISVIDLDENGTTRTYPLHAPALDGVPLDTILFAETMDFTADGLFLIYDALNELELLDGSTVEAWSIFALDLATGQSQFVVPPSPGLDIAFPSLSQRSDNFVVFDVFDQTSALSTITTADLTTGSSAALGTVNGYGVPGYSGDDTAVVYSQNNDTPTAFSLVRQPLAADRITPQGVATEWLAEGDFSVIYRRGTFVGPGFCAGDCDGDGAVTINELIQGVGIALGSLAPSACAAMDRDGDNDVSIAELIAAVSSALTDCNRPFAPGAVADTP